MLFDNQSVAIFVVTTLYQCDECGSLLPTANEARTHEMQDQQKVRNVHRIVGANKQIVVDAMKNQKERGGNENIPDDKAMEEINKAVAASMNKQKDVTEKNDAGTKKSKGSK